MPQVSQDNSRYLPDTSPITSPDSRIIPNEATRLSDSIVRSPAMPLSIIDFAVDLTLLSEPLIPLSDELLLLPVPVPERQQPSPGVLPPMEPIVSVDTSQVDRSREGLFDAYCGPSDSDGHPLMSTRLPGCPYRMTTYREWDVARVDPKFGVQAHHPRFLECIGAPESARLLGRSPVDWVHEMDRQDILAAALELQRDAGLMASNLSVLNQYVISLHRMSTEVLQLVFGQEIFPSQAVDEVAQVAQVPRVQRAPPRWRPWVCGAHCLARVVPGWTRYSIVLTVWVVPSAHQDYPVKHLQLAWIIATCSFRREHSKILYVIMLSSGTFLYKCI